MPKPVVTEQKPVVKKPVAGKSAAKRAAHKPAPTAPAVPPGAVYQIKVTLEEIEPLIWRRLLVPAEIKLSKLHDFLQIAFGWTDSHMHHFFNPEQEFFAPKGMADDDFGGPPSRDTAKTRLADVMTKTDDALRYEYDFGDGWMHYIELEKILAATPHLHVPSCIAGENAGPPDDCGGPPGYQHLMAVMANPKHPDFKEMREWVAQPFDPRRFDLPRVNARLNPKLRRVWVKI